jgi:hypothetical protein
MNWESYKRTERKITKETLDNGLEFTHIQNTNIPTAGFSMMYPIGFQHSGTSLIKPALPHIFEHILYNASNIVEIKKEAGIAEAYTSNSATWYKLFGIASDVMQYAGNLINLNPNRLRQLNELKKEAEIVFIEGQRGQTDLIYQSLNEGWFAIETVSNLQRYGDGNTEFNDEDIDFIYSVYMSKGLKAALISEKVPKVLLRKLSKLRLSEPVLLETNHTPITKISDYFEAEIEGIKTNKFYIGEIIECANFDSSFSVLLLINYLLCDQGGELVGMTREKLRWNYEVRFENKMVNSNQMFWKVYFDIPIGVVADDAHAVFLQSLAELRKKVIETTLLEDYIRKITKGIVISDPPGDQAFFTTCIQQLIASNFSQTFKGNDYVVRLYKSISIEKVVVLIDQLLSRQSVALLTPKK